MSEEQVTHNPEETVNAALEPKASSSAASPALGFSFLALALIVFVSLFGYSIHERNVAHQFAQDNDQNSVALKDTRAQLASLSAKLDSMTAERQAPAPAVTPVRQAASASTATHRSKPDPRWKKFQNELDAQGKQIDSTRQDLASTRQDLVSTRTDLQGSIAKTHDDLVVLQRKGERNYYEFDLDKSKHFTHAGPVEISLRKANTKHDYADLELMVDDREMSKKHLNIYEPAMFYPGEAQQPMEVVINSIGKNHIHGYISAPKYRASELAAMSSGNTAPATSVAETTSNTTNPQLRPR
jgi:hypothetical protein